MADYEWKQFTLGQNETIAKVAADAAKASALLNANLKFVKTAFELGKVLLLAAVNPQLILLVAIANEIDKFVDDLKGTGFYILEVTPTGFEVTPSDAEGNPIALLFSPIGLATNYTIAAAAGLGTQFNEALKKNKITAVNGVFDRSKYEITIDASLPPDQRTKEKNGDALALRDDIFGMAKMTPSQVIATMIAAMDDKKDDRRPDFSDSADVAAIIVVIGFADLTKNAPSLKTVLDLFVDFFGGPNGLFTKGVKSMADGLGETLQNLADPEAYNSDIEVQDVCKVRGTDEDKKVLRQLISQSQWNEYATDASKYYYNTTGQFEVGDLVIGPIKNTAVEDAFGIKEDKAIGYVSEVINTTVDEDDETSGAPYVRQNLKIQCLSQIDKYDFDNFGTGALLQQVAYSIKEGSYIDQNSMEVVDYPPKNAYKLITDLTFSEAASVSKVEKQPKDVEKSGKVISFGTKVLLEEYGAKSVVEEHGSSFDGVGFQTKNSIQGKIVKSKEKEKEQGPPPNFKAAKLEDLMDDLKRFFQKIQIFTNGMRSFADGAKEDIDKMFKFLEDKIKELEELNKAIQAILKIFTTGLPDSGVYSLYIPSTTGGNNAIKAALAEATNGPPNSLDYSVGFMMVGGAAAIDPLLSLISG